MHCSKPMTLEWMAWADQPVHPVALIQHQHWYHAALLLSFSPLILLSHSYNELRVRDLLFRSLLSPCWDLISSHQIYRSISYIGAIEEKKREEGRQILNHAAECKYFEKSLEWSPKDSDHIENLGHFVI